MSEDIAWGEHDVDVAINWIAERVAVFDNIRYRSGEWSLRLSLEKGPDIDFKVFVGPTFGEVVMGALDYVINERFLRGIRGGDS